MSYKDMRDMADGDIRELVRIRHELRRLVVESRPAGGVDTEPVLRRAEPLIRQMESIAARDPQEYAQMAPELSRWRSYLRLGGR